LAGNRPRFPDRTIRAADPRLLVLFCHPKRHRSRVNRRLVEAVTGLPGVTVHDLYEGCPDGQIHVPAEQELVEAHDTLVLQHPFYWYSVPPLLKEWFDLVLTWGWAYGRGGNALRGKRLVTAITTGGPEEAYQHAGFHGRTTVELLAPIAQTAALCGMDYLPPFVVHGTHALEDDAVQRAADEYRAVIGALAEGRVPDSVRALPRLNADLSWTLQPVAVPEGR
jgi:glutathione-regulated potassium-efflux system ancillary protein KefG